MTYCYDFIKKFKKEGNFCGLDKSEISRLETYIDEILKPLTSHGLEEKDVVEKFPLGAARVLIPIKDERRGEGLDYVEHQIREGKRITAKDLQEKLEISNNKPESKPQKEKEPQKQETKKSTFSPQPGTVPVTDNPPQASLADQIRKQELEQAGKNQKQCEKQPAPSESDGKNWVCISGNESCVYPCYFNEKTDRCLSGSGRAITCERIKPDQIANPEWTQDVCRSGTCPDGECHLIKGQHLGDKCALSGGFIRDQPFCPYLERQRRAKEMGFVPASQLRTDPITGGTYTVPPPAKIVPTPVSAEQAEEWLTKIVRGYLTNQQRDVWEDIRKTGQLGDTNLEIFQGLIDGAGARLGGA